MKKELTLADIRKALKETQYPSVWEKTDVMSDEKLRKSRFYTDFSMDSLDVIELTMCLERDLGASLPDNALSTFSHKGGTVQAMIEAFNDNL